MREQILILVDEKDRILGYAPRKECHRGEGKRHRGFVILLYNKDKKILLQHRKHRLFDKLWDLAAASHPMQVEGKNESYLQAAQRCLRDEWGIVGARLNFLGAFNYQERYGEGCENEHCALIVGRWDEELSLDPKHAYGLRWLSLGELLRELEANPSKFTPWLREAIELLKCSNFIDQLL